MAKWTKTGHGYHVRNRKGKIVYEHTEIVERVLGRKLKGRECIHHVDGDKTNNENSNLVVCPDDKYHQLLHRRQRALEATGDANMLKCCYCLEYDKPENLRIYAKSPPRHGECNKRYWHDWDKRKKQSLLPGTA